MSRTPTCEQVRLLDGTPTRIRHGHGIDEPCPFGPPPDRADRERLNAVLAEARDKAFADHPRKDDGWHDGIVLGLAHAAWLLSTPRTETPDD